MVTFDGRLLLLLSVVRTVDMRALSGNDIERLNAIIDGAKGKFSSAEYFFVDDPLPGDYFDSIVSAAKILEGIFKEHASSKTSDQGIPFGNRECRLLPEQFRNCRVQPRIAETMSGIENTLRDAKISSLDSYVDLHKALTSKCETFDIHSVLKSAIMLMGEQCRKGLSEDGSIEQDMQRRMMQYAEKNDFGGGSENNCLQFFITHFTGSSQALRIFKTAGDKYVLATTTVYAFCTVFRPAQNESVNRAKAAELHAALAKSLSNIYMNKSVPWACDADSKAKIEADIAALDLARLNETGDKIKREMSSTDYFFNKPSVADYFDGVGKVAGYLDVVMKADFTNKVREKWWAIYQVLKPLIPDLSPVTDEQATPFGLNECRILPAELRDFTVAPIISSTLNAIQASMGEGAKLAGRYGRMVKACETSGVDDSLKTLKALMGKGCEEGGVRNGTVEAAMQQGMVRYAEEHEFGGGNENNCLHLFVARYTKSKDAVQMFKKSFDKFLFALVTISAICSPFTPKCNEEAYRAQVIDAHASFAASLARTSSIQLNETMPPKCDDSQQVAISKMNASCERVKSTAASDTNFLVEMNAEQFENMTFAMSDALTSLNAKVLWSFRGATTDPVYELFTQVKYGLMSSQSRLQKNDPPNLDVCTSRFNATDVLKVITELLAPGCQNGSVGVPDNIQGWRQGLFDYAKSHNFDGCDENRCPQIFIARYTNHSKEAIEKLQHSMDKYVYISVFLKSFCDSFFIAEEPRSERRRKTLQAVRSLKDGMDLVRNLSSQEGTTKPCARDEIDGDWAEKAKSYARDVISAEIRPVEERPWEDRQVLHETAAKGIVERLNELADNEKYGIFKQYSSEALAYLPYVDDDDERHCFLSLPNNYDVVRANVFGAVNYMVTRRMMATLGSNVTTQWATIEKNAKEILEATFLTRADNLTSHLEEVEKRFGTLLTENGFWALAALRCGYNFVWYELGYRYFPAGYATGNHTLFTKNDNKYSDKCGQIIFFL